MSKVVGNVEGYIYWLKQWMYADLPSFDMSIDNKYVAWISYVLLIPTVILLHTFVLSGLFVALVSNVILYPLGKLLNTIKSFIT